MLSCFYTNHFAFKKTAYYGSHTWFNPLTRMSKVSTKYFDRKIMRKKTSAMISGDLYTQRAYTCLPDFVMTISVPMAENLCHNSLWFNRKLGAVTDSRYATSSSRITAAEADVASPPTVPAASGKCDDVRCSRLKRQHGKWIGSYMSATATVYIYKDKRLCKSITKCITKS